MMTLAVAPVCVPRCGGLLRVQRLDGDERLVQERPHRREKVGVAAGHGGELDGAPGRYHGAACFADPVAKRCRLFFFQKDGQNRRGIEDDHPGSPRSS